jgi:hypothetical protein
MPILTGKDTLPFGKLSAALKLCGSEQGKLRVTQRFYEKGNLEPINLNLNTHKWDKIIYIILRQCLLAFHTAPCV